MGEPKPNDIPVEEQLPSLENVTGEQLELIVKLAAAHALYKFGGLTGSEEGLVLSVITGKAVELKHAFGDNSVTQITLRAVEAVIDGVTNTHEQEYPIKDGS